jgi:hypothetical protein
MVTLIVMSNPISHLAPKFIDLDKMHNMVLAEIETLGSQKAFAKEVGISTQFMNDIVHCRRDIPQSVLEYLGYTKKTYFERDAD